MACLLPQSGDIIVTARVQVKEAKKQNDVPEEKVNKEANKLGEDVEAKETNTQSQSLEVEENDTKEENCGSDKTEENFKVIYFVIRGDVVRQFDMILLSDGLVEELPRTGISGIGSRSISLVTSGMSSLISLLKEQENDLREPDYHDQLLQRKINGKFIFKIEEESEEEEKTTQVEGDDNELFTKLKHASLDYEELEIDLDLSSVIKKEIDGTSTTIDSVIMLKSSRIIPLPVFITYREVQSLLLLVNSSNPDNGFEELGENTTVSFSNQL